MAIDGSVQAEAAFDCEYAAISYPKAFILCWYVSLNSVYVTTSAK